MPSKYKFTKMNVKKIGNIESGTFIFSHNDDTPMNMKDLKTLNDKFKKSKMKYYIRVHSNLPNIFVAKSFAKDDLDDDLIEYLMRGTVGSTVKFEKLYKIEIGYNKKLF
jgi:hypothetical protein